MSVLLKLSGGANTPAAVAGGCERFSIGVCTSDSDPNLKALMALIEEERFPAGHTLQKVIVVASHCDAATLAYLRNLSQLDERIVLVEEPARRGKAAAINKIIERYEGGFLVIVNGDALPNSGAIGRLLIALTEDGMAGMVAGRPVFGEDAGLLSKVLGLMWTVHNDCSRQLNHAGVSNQCSDELLAARSEVVRHLPAGVVNDGAFLAGAAYCRGYRIKFCSEAVVRIEVPRRLVDLMRQRRRILFGHLQVWKLLGQVPRTIETLLVTSPWTSLGIMIRTLARTPRLIPVLPVALTAETVSMIAAMLDSIGSTNKHVVWERHGS